MKTFDIDETFTAKAADGYTKITFTVIGRDELKRAKELSFKGGNFSTALNLATDHTQAVSAYGDGETIILSHGRRADDHICMSVD